jgi:ABC-type bacteriocin/lantibiotic exporter with double-glycine peptidase domain
VLGASIYAVFFTWHQAVQSSIEESSQKYELYYRVKANDLINDFNIDSYLSARDQHFGFIKRNTVILSTAFVGSQLILLVMGIYFIQTNQLSIGQLVSAEIILSGILISMMKLPKTLESLYDFETSQCKLSSALENING